MKEEISAVLKADGKAKVLVGQEEEAKVRKQDKTQSEDNIRRQAKPIKEDEISQKNVMKKEDSLHQKCKAASNDEAVAIFGEPLTKMFNETYREIG